MSHEKTAAHIFGSSPEMVVFFFCEKFNDHETPKYIIQEIDFHSSFNYNESSESLVHISLFAR